jgi:hypothetical protein
MSDFDALCPHCEEKFKLSMIGLETKEFIRCPLCEDSLSSTLLILRKRHYGFRIQTTNFWPQIVIVSWEVKKGDGAMMKIGDRFKDKTTGKIYIIRSETDNGTLSLEGENGLGRRLTGKESLERTCQKLEDIKS